jgi:hypothetical protein
MQYRLRTLLIVLALGPVVLANRQAIPRAESPLPAGYNQGDGAKSLSSAALGKATKATTLATGLADRSRRAPGHCRTCNARRAFR